MPPETEHQIPLSEVEKIVQRIDPGMEEDAHKAAVVVFSCMVVGVDVDALRSYTGYSADLVEFIVGNLRANDQVKDGLLWVDWLEENGQFHESGFLVSVLCAMGMVSIKWKPHDAAKSGQLYQHPDDPSLTWSGRGRRPKWLRELLESGATLNELQTA